MSLMEKIRGGTESGAMRVVLGVIVVVFVFWGIGTGGMNTSQVIAEVNGKRITDTRYHQAMKQNPEARNRSLTEEQHRQVALNTIKTLITQEVLLQEADRLGIEVSGEEVARTILGIPIFADETGEYSQELFTRYLKSMGATRAQFETDIRNELILSRLRNVAMQATTVDEEAIRERWFDEMTSFQLDMVAVRSLAFYDDVEPTEAEIETFIAENRPEIRAWYDEHFESRFHKPTRAKVRMILLKSPSDPETQDEDASEALAERMKLIQAELDGGADFAMLARKYSEDLSAESGGLLGEVHYEQLDTSLGNAIFGGRDAPDAQPGLRPVARTERGLHLLMVEEILPEETTEEKDARAEIADILMQEQRAPTLAEAFAGKLHSAWNESGELPLELLAEQSLRVEPVGPLTLAAPNIPGFGSLDELREALDESEEGALLPVIDVPGAWLVAKVATRSEPDSTRLEEELPLLAPQFEAMQRQEFMRAWIDDLVAQARIKEHHNF
jgi:peptidyl-prolyl cis-trans isomerase D